MSKIPVFVSCPTDLNEEQEKFNQIVNTYLEDLGLERRALGRSDYPVENPLHEVYALAKHCSGGIILGFEQGYIDSGTKKRGMKAEGPIKEKPFPSDWNNLEAGILYSLGLPLLVIKEDGITGGIFDIGTSKYFVHTMSSQTDMKQVFRKWANKVYKKYYK